MPNIAIAKFSHEGNSFTPVATNLTAFQNRAWAIGEAEARAIYGGTANEIGGVLAFLDTRPDWRGIFLRMATASPAGPLPRETFETILGEILAGLRGRRLDAVYLALHGAMLVDDEPRADLELLRRVRECIGADVPLGASFDLHANMDPAIAHLIDFGAGYKTHPHIDGRETALRVLEVLERCVSQGLRPKGAIAKLDAILPSINMRTDDGPMAEMEVLARGVEAGGEGILDATIFGGFSYGDSQAAGAGVMVFAERAGTAEYAAVSLLEEFRTRRARFYIALPNAAEGIRRALAAPRLPVAVTDSGDNPGSGGIGDTPAMLRALLAAAPAVPVLFAFFADPALVERAHAAGEGGAIEGTLGARLTRDFGEPVPFRGRVEKLTDGLYRNRGPMNRGVPASFGPTALLSLAGTPGGENVRLIVSTLCTSPNDPGLLDIHGISLDAVAVLCVKAKNHFRAAFKPLLADIIDIDAPGPAALDIATFPFHYTPRTLYPLRKEAP